MAKQAVNTRAFIVYFKERPFPSPEWYVSDHYEGKDISGGPVIAVFYEKEFAEEYAQLKNNKRDGKDKQSI